MKEVLELQAEYNEIDKTSINELLKWFMKAYFYNDEIIKAGMYRDEEHDDVNTIYTDLIKLGYKPITEDKEGLKLLKDIKEEKTKKDAKNVGYIRLEQILPFIKGNKGIDRSNINWLLEYHYKYNREFLYDLLMQSMANNIGNKVVVTGLHYNEPMIEIGEKVDIKDEDYIVLNQHGEDKIYKFIGSGYYITRIHLDDETNTTLYFNPNNYVISNLITPNHVAVETRKLFDSKGKSMAA